MDDAEQIQQLGGRFAAGDSDAFQELFGLLNPLFERFVVSRCRLKGLPTSEGEEVAQNAWIRAWNSRGTFDGRNFRGWLYTIGRNLIIDYLKNKRPNQLPEGFNAASDEMAQLACLEHAEELAALRDCMESVGGNFVRVYQMQLDGVATVDIAAQEQISLGTVYTRVVRAKKELRTCVEQKLK